MQSCYDTDGEAHELLPCSENTCLMDAASRLLDAVCSSHGDIQIGNIVKHKTNAKESLHGNKERIRRLRSLPSHSLKNLTSLRQLKIRDQRKCSSENLDNIFSKTAFSVESSKTGTPHITYPNLSLKLENGAAFGVDVINPCNANGNLCVEEEIINDERVSFISDSYACGMSDRRSKTLGSVRYDRMSKSQSQYEFSASGTGSDCSLRSLLSTPSIQNPSLGAKLLSPRPQSKLGRMVLSKNLRRIKSNPLFLQASMDNASHSRPVCELGLTMNYEPPTGRNRSQSDPPARLYNLRDSQSQLFSPLSKGKSKSSQSLAMQRVKKAFRATRATVIACAITTAFVLSYLPHLSLTLLRSVWIEFEHQLDGASLVLYNIFIRSYFVNTAINIFVYGTMNREFRDEASKIWTQIKSSCSRRK
ncbi:hypothetical protein EGW08_012154 [Elysia chlorotica]|uniref:G-protein coupled receptors family 1 profile domain-containing protein n=1 Tax=Elysia chlorotica TaxID=188477 RepID=A0A433TET5_ELYCH|nr:hypothetical protein EGW08_012154 [Elysia chlorotica]